MDVVVRDGEIGLLGTVFGFRVGGVGEKAWKSAIGTRYGGRG